MDEKKPTSDAPLDFSKCKSPLRNAFSAADFIDEHGKVIPPPPGDIQAWQFRDDDPTTLQVERYGSNDWKLGYISDGDYPEYWMELDPDARSIIHAFMHVSQKDWVEPLALMKALMPAMTAVLGWQDWYGHISSLDRAIKWPDMECFDG